MATKDVSDLQVCLAYAHAANQRGDDWKRDYEYPYEMLQRATGQCFKVCYRAMERASDRGLVDYGVSLRTGWLTDKGKALIKAAVAAHLDTLRQDPQGGMWIGADRIV